VCGSGLAAKGTCHPPHHQTIRTTQEFGEKGSANAHLLGGEQGARQAQEAWVIDEGAVESDLKSLQLNSWPILESAAEELHQIIHFDLTHELDAQPAMFLPLSSSSSERKR
jgi:hypothetical protein